MSNADMYKTYTCDWMGDEFTRELKAYLCRETGCTSDEADVYLKAEDMTDILDMTLFETDIAEHLASLSGLSVFKIMVLVEARESFIEEVAYSYHVFEDMMCA